MNKHLSIKDEPIMTPNRSQRMSPIWLSQLWYPIEWIDSQIGIKRFTGWVNQGSSNDQMNDPLMISNESIWYHNGSQDLNQSTHLISDMSQWFISDWILNESIPSITQNDWVNISDLIEVIHSLRVFIQLSQVEWIDKGSNTINSLVKEVNKSIIDKG